MGQNPVWTILCYQGAIWAGLVGLVVWASDLPLAGGALMAIAGTALGSAAALKGGKAAASARPEPEPSARDTAPKGSQWSALDAIPLALVIVGRERDIRFANRAARAMLEGELAGRPLLSVLRDPALIDALEQSWRSGGEARGVAVTLAPGREIAADLGIAGTGADAQALLLLRDVSGERRLERLRSDFIANVSHELKTPVSALLGFIETLRGPARDDQGARERFLSIMQDQARRMDRLVADLLSLSRIELQEHSRPREEVDLAQVLKSAADSLVPRSRERRMALNLPVPDPSPRLRGAADELVQVFQNLIENAIRYGRPDTPIDIEVETSRDPARTRERLPALREAAGVVSVTVRDRGQGIAREHLPRLTERFYRVDPARSREMGGTGLGLAIVKHIVQRHRGSLSIESEPGKGSAFTVHLPIDGDA